MNPTPEQIQAINTREGAYCVMATAGSGKTTVLTKRIQALFREGATIDDLLALTFTVEAAANMEKRIGIKVPKTSRGGFRTFHSFALNLVRQEARFLSYGLSADPFPDVAVLSKLLLGAMRDTGVPRNEKDSVRAFISANKRQRITPDNSLLDPYYAKTYDLYEQRLKDGGMLDYDGMIVEAVNVLETHAEVRDRWQFKWPHCDEGQDTDNLQFRLLQLISQRYGNIFVVGDFCQSVYQFRGAHPENLLEFEKWFPNAKTLILPENFRSSREIVDFSRQNAPIENELTKNIRTSNPTENVPIDFRMYPGAAEEAEAVLSYATQDLAHSAVLARTNQQLGIFETLCTQHEIRFFRLGKSGFWNQPEVKNLVHLMNFCVSNKPATKYSEQLLLSHRGMIRNQRPEVGLKYVIQHSNLENLYSNDDYSDDENFALSNLRSVVEISKRFSTIQEFLNHARRAMHASRKGKNALTLSTVHQAKGLEWKNVFLVGAQEGLLPHKKGEIAEEKRIFYVAITRAQKYLRISFSGTPSPFLEPFLTPEILEELRKTRTTVEKIQKQQELFA
jgi:DNA helicase-2/ATP-dependent DNA helicase PcrA